MTERYNYLMDLLEEIDKGSETIAPNDEDLELALHEIYFEGDSKKLEKLVHVLTNIYFKNGKFKTYLEAFEETITDLYNDYGQIDERYFNEKEKNNIKKFYTDSIKRAIINN